MDDAVASLCSHSGWRRAWNGVEYTYREFALYYGRYGEEIWRDAWEPAEWTERASVAGNSGQRNNMQRTQTQK